jgi:hypothetical protein
MTERQLPPSLAVVPNIPYEEQTLEQLRLERDYWQMLIDKATSWGASLKAADDFCKACEAWIKRREAEANGG